MQIIYLLHLRQTRKAVFYNSLISILHTLPILHRVSPETFTTSTQAGQPLSSKARWSHQYENFEKLKTFN